MSDKDEEILEQLEEAHDALEEIVRLAGERDGEDYLRDLRIRVKKADGIFFISMIWLRHDEPAESTIYSPAGCWMYNWYKVLHKDGTVVWESGLELL